MTKSSSALRKAAIIYGSEPRFIEPYRIRLDYDGPNCDFGLADAKAREKKIANVSAAVWTGFHLWTVTDEGATIERLIPSDSGFSAADSIPLSRFFPQMDDGKEADLEALAWDAESRRLWLCSSHSRSRGKTDDSSDPEIFKKLNDNDTAEPDKSRTLLGFIPIDATGQPKEGAGKALPHKEKKGSLLWAIGQQSGALAQSLELASKENGLDIEGIAVKGLDIILGLRGPAIGGYALALRLKIALDGDKLAIKRKNGGLFQINYLPLNGLGIRDLCRDGHDALVLAGPTMDLDAPYCLYRWRDAFAPQNSGQGLVKEVEILADLPFERSVGENGLPGVCERPEGMTRLVDGKLLIVHDKPNLCRLKGLTLAADVYDLPSRLPLPPS